MKSNPPILFVLPYAQSDSDQALDLLVWIKQLGGCKRNPCLLVSANNVQPAIKASIKAAAVEAFSTVYETSPPYPLLDEKWPRGGNWLFATAASWIARNMPIPFWWGESDCIPLETGFFDMLQEEYYRVGKPFMGTIVDGIEIGGKKIGPMVNGVAIYPGDTARRFAAFDSKGRESWDVWMTPIALPETHHSKLIQHFWGEMGLAPTFAEWHEKGEPKNTFTMEQVSPEAVVFHRCKDGTLTTLLRRQRKIFAPMVREGIYHSGNLGDIIYGLYSLKKIGGANLLIGPEQRNTSPAGVAITQAQFDLLKPLLDQQPYIAKSSFAPVYPKKAFDFNTFRNAWSNPGVRAKTGITLLAQMHMHVLAIDQLFQHDEPWLQVPTTISHGMFVVHRSARYRNQSFPWPLILRHFEGRLLFVGHPDEHEEFTRTFRVKVGYWKPRDFLELAQVIAGAQGFIGNQSFPCSVAIALGQRIIQEAWPQSPDCLFMRRNFLPYIYGTPFTKESLEEWENSAL